MAFNGSGTFTRSHNWVTDKTNTVAVTASRMDTECDGFATGLSTALCKDGQQTATARIPFALGVSSMSGAVGGASYAHVSDLNTGLYFPAADQWGLTAGGVGTLTSTATAITAAVNLSITGTLAADDLDIGDDVDIDGTLTTNELVVETTATVGTTLGVTGNFAVNTTSFTVAAATGNTVIAGTLDVDDAVTVTNDLTSTNTIQGAAVTATAAVTGATAAGAMVASQAEQEAGTAVDKLVTPGRQHFHKGSAKAWGSVTFGGGSTPTLSTGDGVFNVDSVTDTNLGQTTINLTTAMSSTVYTAIATFQQQPNLMSTIVVTDKGTSSFRVRTGTSTSSANTTYTSFDADFDFVVYGDL